MKTPLTEWHILCQGPLRAVAIPADPEQPFFGSQEWKRTIIAE